MNKAQKNLGHLGIFWLNDPQLEAGIALGRFSKPSFELAEICRDGLTIEKETWPHGHFENFSTNRNYHPGSLTNIFMVIWGYHWVIQ